MERGRGLGMQPTARVSWDDTRWKIMIDGSVALAPMLHRHLSDMVRLRNGIYNIP